MAPVVITNLLLLCGALIVSAYAQDNKFGDCPLPNVTQGNNYTLTVSPTSYHANSSYSVTVKGSIDSTTVLFQVIDSTNNYIASGWQNGTQACNGSHYQISANQTSLISNWNSPNSTSITSVTIRAYVRTENNSTSMLNFTLAYVGSTVSPPATANTTMAISKTTNSAPTLLASCTILGIIQVTTLAFLCHLIS